MNKSVRIVIAVLLLFAGISSATACLYNGRSYPEGTVIGDRICRDGRWVPR